MYTNTIVGSCNTIFGNSEQHAVIMKPPIRRQPKKSHSKEHPHYLVGSLSEESPSGPSGVASVNSVLSPESVTSPGDNPASGLDILGNIQKFLLIPDKGE